jgi:serine/threonine protein kinase
MSAPSPSKTSFGPFTLDRKLAEGGMAEVFLARQGGFGGFEKQVVVKRILPSLASHTDFVDMFLNEARLAARLSHGNVVQVIEAGEIDGQYYIAMEYIDGLDLKSFYDEAERTKRGMPPGVACRIIADLLAGLHYAHTLHDEKGRPLGIVHRDVTPQNVLITRNGTVKIVDFGIAKATNAASQQTRVGQVKGKIAYLSPEQAMGRGLDARSDVFACGILLWELVTGQRLFSRASDMASIIAITDDELPTARSVRAELPESLDIVLTQALARPITDRYPSALAMQQELEQLIRSEGWAGDRRTLEKYIQARVTSLTPAHGLTKLPEPRIDFGEQATVMGLPADQATVMGSPLERQPARRADPANERMSNLATVMGMPIEAARISTVETKSLSRDDVAKATAWAQRPMSPPMPQPTPYRTPSDMHAMPAPSSSLGRRVAVASAAAAVAIVVAIVALSWHTDGAQPTVSELGAHVTIELSEPALIELDGHKQRIDRTGELAFGVGHQATITATTVRGKGAEVTRSIALPPAREGERIPVKISFP